MPATAMIEAGSNDLQSRFKPSSNPFKRGVHTHPPYPPWAFERPASLKAGLTPVRREVVAETGYPVSGSSGRYRYSEIGATQVNGARMTRPPLTPARADRILTAASPRQGLGVLWGTGLEP